ncbi:Crp/Fnr family transcriptional regulator [Furfurilactobacillus siliginis]|uniref:Crp/Fnr family transcriptional regulator n=1 Tax=Furfurilactobacillus siliginis TaxID=348151 RepID=A0A0R2L1Q9_9LACO|nr:Crp/Fnr family transcriptional regulator [Furfurilactobacillus siliginis]KRN95753.1 transcription regulator [Furfurilactobacillus siliginis]GEK28971.1 Crp/Fnr family transcriptional regulator [Furfurilactobacillus siliginis]
MHNHLETAHQCIELVPIFKTLSVEDLKQVTSLVHEQQFTQGETVFAAGTHADALMIVAHGQVKVYQGAANGREQLLYLLQPGDFDGEAALFKEVTRTSSAVALVDTNVCMISRQAFQALLQRAPQLALNMVNAFGERINRLERQTTAVTTTSVEGRLADYLVETAASFPSGAQFTLPMPKKDIAVYLGTTPETISRKLKLFEDAGLLQRFAGNRVQLTDVDQLALISD